MSQVDLIQEAFVVAPPAAVAARVHDAALWRALWPGLAVQVTEDRGLQGIRWSVSGPLVGSSEVWLEPYGDGVIVHCYLRVDPAGGRLPERRAVHETRRRQQQLTRVLWRLKDTLEGRRAPGEPGRAVKPRPGAADT